MLWSAHPVSNPAHPVGFIWRKYIADSVRFIWGSSVDVDLKTLLRAQWFVIRRCGEGDILMQLEHQTTCNDNGFDSEPGFVLISMTSSTFSCEHNPLWAKIAYFIFDSVSLCKFTWRQFDMKYSIALCIKQLYGVSLTKQFHLS